MDFEWDAAKEKENLRKHNVTFLEAIESFSDPNGFVVIDDKHSENEPRFYWIGKVASGKVLTTRFTRRAGKIRIFGSAEWREFRRMYNEKAKRK
ncbi:MAG: BrnT family toxin [Deltaproteobacteria bacterium]|nr:BrnT family toxin [Deltaproteobacteria bacterium]